MAKGYAKGQTNDGGFPHLVVVSINIFHVGYLSLMEIIRNQKQIFLSPFGVQSVTFFAPLESGYLRRRRC